MLRRPLWRMLIVIAVLDSLFLAGITAAEPAGNVEERLAKTRADLKSEDTAVRRAAIGGLVHSDLSSTLAAEIQSTLNDSDGDVRSVAATATGNLGAVAVPAIPQLARQLKGD